jgi:hypothetical protein
MERGKRKLWKRKHSEVRRDLRMERGKASKEKKKWNKDVRKKKEERYKEK